MVGRMGWVVRHGISAWLGTWAGLSGTRFMPRSCGVLVHLHDSCIVGYVVCVPGMGLVCYLVIAYLLGCPWQIVPCGCVTLGDWTIVRGPYLVA